MHRTSFVKCEDGKMHYGNYVVLRKKEDRNKMFRIVCIDMKKKLRKSRNFLCFATT